MAKGGSLGTGPGRGHTPEPSAHQQSHLRHLHHAAWHGNRFHVKVHRKMRTITESPYFNGFIMFVISANALALAMETEDALKTKSWSLCFSVLDYIFLLVYTIEFIMKIIAEPVRYWKSGYNLFDFLILITSLANTILSWSKHGENDDLAALRVLRALRTLRTLRTVSFIKGLQVIIYLMA